MAQGPQPIYTPAMADPAHRSPNRMVTAPEFFVFLLAASLALGMYWLETSAETRCRHLAVEFQNLRTRWTTVAEEPFRAFTNASWSRLVT